MSYQYKPHSHVKVWLTNNPQVFMNFENQTRLIEMREQNPKDPIHLIFDSSLLNSDALVEVREFCTENNITPVDADQFKNNLKSDKERQLFEFYKDEITHLKEGGNLGVASDILRWLSASYSLGSYTDLDVPLDTRTVPERVTVEAPLLLNIGSLKLLGTKEMLLTLNEYIAVVDEEAAKEQIERVQSGLIKKLGHYGSDYMQKTEAMLSQGSFLNRILIGYMKNRAEALYIQKSTELHPSNGIHTSRNLRAYVNEVMTNSEKYVNFKKESVNEPHEEVILRLRKELATQQSFSKWLFFRKDYHETRAVLAQTDDKLISYLMKKERSLYLKSIVICTTGPIEVANSLYDTYVMDFKEVNEKVRPSTFSHYELHNAFLSRNVIPLHEDPWSMLKFLGADVGELNDSSWLEEGMNLQQVRQVKLVEKQRQLVADLPFFLSTAKKDIESHLNKLEQEAEGWLGFWGRTRRDAKIAALKEVLGCFDEKNQSFDIAIFRQLSENMDKNTVFAGFFSRRTEDLFQSLEQLCHEAIVLRIAKGKKLPVAAVEDTVECSTIALAKMSASQADPELQKVTTVSFKKQSTVNPGSPTHCKCSLFATTSEEAKPVREDAVLDSQYRSACAG
jgi:glucosyltransferase Lgt1/2/3